jgi:short-subunit dehydrogenase
MAETSGKPIGVVTGASSGLGIDFAAELAKDGYDLVLVARSTAALERVAADLKAKHGANSHVLTHDLAKAGAGAALAAAIAEAGIEPEVLINNAGFGSNDDFATADAGMLSEMTQLNVVTLTDLTRALLPGMLAKRKGRIMLLASTASFQPGPHMAVYCATKAYVLSFGEAIAYELRGTGVTVTTVCPGATKTGFQNTAGIDEGSPFLQGGMMSSAEVARQGYRAMKAGLPVTVTGVPNLIGAVMGRHMPHALVLPMAARLLAK